jgi:hypothetical protein
VVVNLGPRRWLAASRGLLDRLVIPARHPGDPAGNWSPPVHQTVRLIFQPLFWARGRVRALPSFFVVAKARCYGDTVAWLARL